jgi:hypothetical protein
MKKYKHLNDKQLKNEYDRIKREIKKDSFNELEKENYREIYPLVARFNDTIK